MHKLMIDAILIMSLLFPNPIFPKIATNTNLPIENSDITPTILQSDGDGWLTYVDDKFGFSMSYPEAWSYSISIEHDLDSPEYLIRRRVTFTGESNAYITIDIWSNPLKLSLLDWLNKNQDLSIIPNSYLAPFEPNAVINGFPALLTDIEGSPFVTVLVSNELYFYRLEYVALDGGNSFGIFTRMLSTMDMHLQGNSVANSNSYQIPEIFIDDNPIISVTECCGVTDDQYNNYICGPKGNCTWWAAYKRRDLPFLNASWGNAYQWYGNAKSTGFGVCTTDDPYCTHIEGAVAWYNNNGGNCTNDNDCGHVAYVESTFPEILEVSEMDYFGTWGACAKPQGYPKLGEPDGYIFGYQYGAVNIYSDPGFFGINQAYYNEGKYTFPFELRNQVSSIHVAPGWSVKLYTGPYQTGDVYITDTDIAQMSNYAIHKDYGFNFFWPIPLDNNIASIEIFHECCLPGYNANFTELSTEGNPVCGGTQISTPKLISPTESALGSRKVTFSWKPSVTEAIEGYQLMVKTIPNMDQGGEEKVNITLGGNIFEYTKEFDQDYGELYWSVRAKKNGQFSPWALINSHVPKFSISTQTSPVLQWHARYYDNHNCMAPGCDVTPKCEADIATLDLNWGSGAPCGMSGDNWGAQFTSNFYFPEGDYVFHVDHDDGAKLWLNGTNIMDVGGSAENNYACSARHLSGNNKLELIYFENSGDARVKADWSTDTSVCTPAQIDSTYPVVEIVSPISSDWLGYRAYIKSLPITVKARATDEDSGINKVEFKAWGALESWKFGTDYTPENGVYSAELIDPVCTPGNPCQYDITVVAYDNAGHSTSQELNVAVDCLDPNVNFSFPSPGTSPENLSYLTNLSVPIRLDISDSDSGPNRVSVDARYGGSETWVNIGMDDDPSNGWSLDWVIPSVANNYPLALRATAQDNVGNDSERIEQYYFVDTTSPWSKVNSFGSDTSSINSFSLSWQGGDSGSGIQTYLIEVRDGDNGTWTTWYSGTDTSQTYIGESGHTYYFRASALDNAGNWEAQHATPDTSLTIILDAEAPTGSVIINSNDKYTTNPEVNLALYATDNVGVTDMELASFNGVSNSWNWYGPEPYMTDRLFTLTQGQGWHTVWAHYYDSIGNISEWANDSIIFDSLPPAAQIYIPDEYLPSHQKTLSLFWDGTDDYTGSNDPGEEYYYHDVPGEALNVVVEDNYAYVAAGEAGLRIIDVSDPYYPHEVGFVNLSDALDVAVLDGIAYVANGFDGLSIIDISEPTLPIVVGTYFSGASMHRVKVKGYGYGVYYAFVGAGTDGLLVIDCTTPNDPYKLLQHVTTGADYWDLVVSEESFIYVVDYNLASGDYDPVIRIIDFSTISYLEEIGIIKPSVFPNGLDLIGSTLYIADTFYLLVVDVSNPHDPTILSSTEHFASFYDIDVVSNFAFLATGDSGIRIVDVTVPTTTEMIGQGDTPGHARGIFIQEDPDYGILAYVADKDGGLQIMVVSDPRYPTLLTGSYASLNSYDVEFRRVSTTYLWEPWLTETTDNYAQFAGSNGNTYCFHIRAHDEAGNLSEWQEGRRCIQIQTPEIEINNYSTDDDAYGDSIGNGDGIPNPGEFVELLLDFNNIGLSDSNTLTVDVSTSDSYVLNDSVYFYDNNLNVGSVPVGSVVTGENLDFGISSSCPDGHIILFDLTIHEDGYPENVWYETIKVLVEGEDTTPPQILYADVNPKSSNLGDPLLASAYLREGSVNSPSTEIQLIAEDGTTSTYTLFDDGMHNDGPAGDHWFATTFSPPGISDYSVRFFGMDEAYNLSESSSLVHITTRPFVAKSKLLFVYDRWDYDYEDPEYIHYYTESLHALGYDFDLWNTAHRGIITSSELLHYVDGAVIWAMPLAGYLGYSPDQQTALQDYLINGGHLFITGQDIGYYLTWGGTTSNSFYQDYLHAQFIQDNVGVFALTGIAGNPISENRSLSIVGGDGANNQIWPSEIFAIFPALPLFSYDTSAVLRSEDLYETFSEPLNGISEFNFFPQKNKCLEDPSVHSIVEGVVDTGTAALTFQNGPSRIVYFAFGFESINREEGDSRTEIMRAVLDWLMPNHAPEQPFNPFPADNANQSNLLSEKLGLAPEEVNLWWNGKDLDLGDSLSYDVYLSEDQEFNSDDLLFSNLANAWFDPRPLMPNHTYYWFVMARDRDGLETSSPTWTFTTTSSLYPYHLFLPLLEK